MIEVACVIFSQHTYTMTKVQQEKMTTDTNCDTKSSLCRKRTRWVKSTRRSFDWLSVVLLNFVELIQTVVSVNRACVKSLRCGCRLPWMVWLAALLGRPANFTPNGFLVEMSTNSVSCGSPVGYRWSRPCSVRCCKQDLLEEHCDDPCCSLWK